MENSIRDTESYGIFSVDASAIGKEQVRRRLLNSIRELGYDYESFDDFWRYFKNKPERLPEKLLVLGDLSIIVKQYRSQGRHHWIASVRDRKPYFLALIRTKADERYANLVDDLVRHSDLRVTVCKDLKKELSECILEAVSALDPHSLIDVRHSTQTNQLWVQFGDGLSGLVDLKQLGLEDQIKTLLLETAIVGDRGAAVEIVQRNGDLFEIDALAIRAMLDASFAARIALEASQSDKKVGERVRSARESAHMTQQQLTKNTGIDQAIISKLERGLHQPRVDTLERIASALGLSLTELLTRM